MHFVDTHFHLDLWPHLEQIIQDIEKHKIYTLAVTNAPHIFSPLRKKIGNSNYIRIGLGYHPQLTGEIPFDTLLFKKEIEKTTYIGEIGLDYTKNFYSHKKEQIKNFEEILEIISANTIKALSIHSKFADSDVIKYLSKYNLKQSSVILHWYSGSIKNLEKAVNLGYYFSVNEQMLLSHNGQKVLNEIPLSRILTESDGPFAHLNKKALSPLDINSTINKISVLKRIDFNKTKEIIYNNFKSLLTN